MAIEVAQHLFGNMYQLTKIRQYDITFSDGTWAQADTIKEAKQWLWRKRDLKATLFDGFAQIEIPWH